MKKIYTIPSINIACFETVVTSTDSSLVGTVEATYSADQANKYLFTSLKVSMAKTTQIADIMKIKE